MKLWMLALVAASMTSLIDTSLELSPYLMLSARVRSNNTGSCDTMPMRDRSQGTFRAVKLLFSAV